MTSLTAAIPMENPHCSCKLKEGITPQPMQQTWTANLPSPPACRPLSLLPSPLLPSCSFSLPTPLSLTAHAAKYGLPSNAMARITSGFAASSKIWTALQRDGPNHLGFCGVIRPPPRWSSGLTSPPSQPTHGRRQPVGESSAILLR